MKVTMEKHSAEFLDEIAANWVARMDARNLTGEEERELQEWLDSDVRSLGAFARARAIFINPDIASAIPVARHRSFARALSKRLGLLAAAACALIVSVVLFGQREQVETRVYVSELGEVRQIPLEDGSRITLNTNSSLQVEYRKDSRRVALQRGEAYFEVAKDAQRPFVVIGSSAQARAIGTSYSVRMKEAVGEMQIRVVSGRVAIEAPQPDVIAPLAAVRNWLGSKANNAAYLNANQQVDVRLGKDAHGSGQIQLSIRDLQPGIFERSLMWREGLLSFEGVTLAEAIEEFSRYSRQKIVIRGALAQERVSGLFAASDPVAFAHAIALSLKIKLRTDEGVITLYRQ